MGCSSKWGVKLEGGCGTQETVTPTSRILKERHAHLDDSEKLEQESRKEEDLRRKILRNKGGWRDLILWQIEKCLE